MMRRFVEHFLKRPRDTIETPLLSEISRQFRGFSDILDGVGESSHQKGREMGWRDVPREKLEDGAIDAVVFGGKTSGSG